MGGFDLYSGAIYIFFWCVGKNAIKIESVEAIFAT